MITEEPVIRFLSAEILTPEGGFLLGRSRLDVDDLGDGDEELTWTPYAGFATSVSADRGGKRAGVVNTVDVGTLTIVLLDAGDPDDTPNMTPNTPVRLISVVTGEPVFTGSISDIDMIHEIDKTTNRIRTYVTIQATDNVQTHANTIRYGAIVSGGFERWEARIVRLAGSSQAPIDPPVVDAPIVRYSL